MRNDRPFPAGNFARRPALSTGHSLPADLVRVVALRVAEMGTEVLTLRRH